MAGTVLIVATDGYERAELEGPRQALVAAGLAVCVASVKAGEIRSWDGSNWGDSITVDVDVAQADVDNYEALLLPGGVMNADSLRTHKPVLDVIRAFDAAKKPIAAIGHTPWLLTDAGVAQGRTVTSWPSLRGDLRRAGTEVVDSEAQVDGTLITSRQPEDVPAFSQALIGALSRD